MGFFMKDKICKGFGGNVKKYRKLRGLTQETLAEALGLEIKSLSLIETGRGFVSSTTLAKLVNVLGVNVSDLFDFNLDKEEELYENARKYLEYFKKDASKLRILNSILKDLL